MKYRYHLIQEGIEQKEKEEINYDRTLFTPRDGEHLD